LAPGFYAGYSPVRQRGVFARAAAWRVLDTGIGIVMFAIAGALLAAR